MLRPNCLSRVLMDQFMFLFFRREPYLILLGSPTLSALVVLGSHVFGVGWRIE